VKLKRIQLISLMVVIVAAIFVAIPFVPARAYSTATTTLPLPTPSTGSSTFDFSFGGSFSNLIQPFQAFFNDLTGAMGGQAVVGPSAVNNETPAPVFSNPNLNIQNGPNILGQWLSGLEQLSLTQILAAMLNWIVWVLGLTQQLIHWLLGFIH
jgi:hypothetical protein